MPFLSRSELIRLSRAQQAMDGAGPLHSVADLAAIARMSRFHFMRRFRLVYGESPNQLLIRRRLRHARELLARGYGSVTEICLQLGYSSPGSFSSLFRRHMGESPLACRRRLWPFCSSPEQAAQQLRPGCMSLMAAAWTAAPAHDWRSNRAPALQDWTQPHSQ